MADPAPQFMEVGDGAARRRIAFHHRPAAPGRDLGVIWLGGFKSDMTSTKALAIEAWCAENGVGMTRFDYSGHGISEGRFEDGTIGRWLEDAAAVLDEAPERRQIIVGSSMGGYLALLLTKRLIAGPPQAAARIAALLLIAPAWDMTEELMWKQFPDSAKRALAETGMFMRPSQYGDPYPITRALIEEGRQHLLARKTFDPGRPVRIIHGLLDPDVPWEHTLDLESFLAGPWTHVHAVPDGEHRLSRPEDIALLIGVLGELVEAAGEA